MAIPTAPLPITQPTTDGRPISTPLNASPGTVVYGPAVSRGEHWDKVKLDLWHTDVAAPHVARVAVLDTDGSTVLNSIPVTIAALVAPVTVLVDWRLRNGLYLAVWWDAVNIGWAKPQADQT